MFGPRGLVVQEYAHQAKTVIREHIGYGHIPAEHAKACRSSIPAHLKPCLNFHRPCGFATVSFHARGKRKRRYKLEDYATPYQKLKSLPRLADYFKDGISLELLDRLAGAMSDLETVPGFRIIHGLENAPTPTAGIENLRN